MRASHSSIRVTCGNPSTKNDKNGPKSANSTSRIMSDIPQLKSIELFIGWYLSFSSATPHVDTVEEGGSGPGLQQDGTTMRGVKHEFVRIAVHPQRLTPIFEPANTKGHAPASTRNLRRIDDSGKCDLGSKNTSSHSKT